MTPPTRRSPSGKYASKRSRSPPEDLPQGKKQKDNVSVKELYMKCCSDDTFVDTCDESGVLELTLWPYFLRLSEAAEEEEEEVRKAAYLVALLTNRRHDTGSGFGVDGPLHFVARSAEEQRPAFRILLESLLAFSAEEDGNRWREDAVKVKFLILTHNSHLQEKALLQSVVNIGMWVHMPSRYRSLELLKNSAFRRNWSTYATNQHKAAEFYIPTLLKKCLALLESGQDPTAIDSEPLLHLTMELLIDLLSTPRTRRYLHPLLISLHFSVKCSLVSKSTFKQQVEMLQDLETFGQTPELYHARAHALQKLLHRHSSSSTFGEAIIYAGVSMICSYPYLKQILDSTEVNILRNVCHWLRLLDRDDNETLQSKELCQAILLYHLTIRSSQVETLSTLPLYPNEALLWNPHLLLSTQKQTTVLALPKLQVSFLSFADYLLRNFTLFRLESAHGIRGDLVDVIRRMRPSIRQDYNEDGDAEGTQFQGWARMGLEIPREVRLVKVRRPNLGETIPSEVSAEIVLDLKRCGDDLRHEWDQIGEFDNLFLVAIDATQMSTTHTEERIPEEEDVTFPKRWGVTAVRGCMVLEVRDEHGTILSDPSAPNNASRGTKRVFKVALDAAQYAADVRKLNNVYSTLNVVVRRHGRENNFKAILETVRGLLSGTGSVSRSLPAWLQPILLGTGGDPASASYMSRNMRLFATKTAGVTPPDAFLDYGDTFLNADHLKSSFPESTVTVDDGLESEKSLNRKKYRLKILGHHTEDSGLDHASAPRSTVAAVSYPFPMNVKGNLVRFTPVQVEAIHSGLLPGLTLIVGPPGTGKTDVAVQIIANLYHSFPTQRTILITHSNAALNDLFEKVMARGDIDERYMLRLGSGERDLQTTSEHDFTKMGRVAHILSRRAALLEQVQLMSESLGISGKAERGADGSPSYTCETAEYFNLHHIQRRIQIFHRKVAEHGSLDRDDAEDKTVANLFPFKSYFGIVEEALSLVAVKTKFERLNEIFAELAEYRPLELLRSQRQRTDYLLMKQARVVAMTCTHAAIVRSHLVELGFHYDNVVMEEAGQMLDIETFIPLLLQRGEADETAQTRLKRVCLIGDHHQLPPVVKNMTFSKYSNLDQSMFTRLIRMGVPFIELNRQGRARADIAQLYSWRYRDLGNLDHVMSSFTMANTGFAHTYQVVNVDDFEGRGESTPTAYFYQNMGEAEYVVATFQYMVLIGYPPEKISLLTTYNGQKSLLQDILSQRCGPGTPLAGIRPGSVSTVDQYQGQQNDYVLLSLVRTKSIGYLRDIRRLVVAVSRARLGLYVFCRQGLFARCHELKPTMDQFAMRPNKLELVTGEHYPTQRSVQQESMEEKKKYVVECVTALGSVVHAMQEELCAGIQQ